MLGTFLLAADVQNQFRLISILFSQKRVTVVTCHSNKIMLTKKFYFRFRKAFLSKLVMTSWNVLCYAN